MSVDREFQCPFCSSNEMRQGFVWTSDSGDRFEYLDWVEGKEPPQIRFLLGRRRDAQIIAESPIPAYRCKGCNSFFLYKMELEMEEVVAEQGPEPDDTSEPTECLSCGKTIGAGMSECPNCGWSYHSDA